MPFVQKFPNADPLALKLLQRLLAFDPKDRPTAEEVKSHISFHSLNLAVDYNSYKKTYSLLSCLI